jgi:osmotically-inducible protein OsmY
MAAETSAPGEIASSSPADRANQILCESPYHCIRRVRCSLADGILTLAGQVPSFYLKQLAQISVRRLEGVRQISNRIEVPTASPE